MIDKITRATLLLAIALGLLTFPLAAIIGSLTWLPILTGLGSITMIGLYHIFDGRLTARKSLRAKPKIKMPNYSGNRNHH